MLTKKQIGYGIGLVLIIIIGFAYMCGRTANAAEPKADGYFVTGASYGDDFGATFGGGAQLKKSGVLFIGTVDFQRVDGQSGYVTVEPASIDHFGIAKWPQPEPVTVPFTTGSQSLTTYRFMVGIPVRKSKPKQ